MSASCLLRSSNPGKYVLRLHCSPEKRVLPSCSFLCVYVHEHESSQAIVSSQGRAVLIQWCVLRSPFSAFPSECSSFYALGQLACSSSLSILKYTYAHIDRQTTRTRSTHSSLPLHILGSILFGRNPALTLTVATHVEPPEATNHE